jgi:hypothetical protein
LHAVICQRETERERDQRIMLRHASVSLDILKMWNAIFQILILPNESNNITHYVFIRNILQMNAYRIHQKGWKEPTLLALQTASDLMP